MEILGLSDSTPKPESRWKSLFWPSVRHEVDVDTIGRQGFWVCFITAILNLIVTSLQGLFLAGLFEAVFFLLGGIGVRQRSRFAAITVFSAYFITTLLLWRIQGFSFLRLLIMALLLANVRATWLSAKWRSDATEPPPFPLDDTWTDKLTDRMPIYVWPVGRWIFYVFAVIENGLLLIALMMPRFGR